MTSGLFQFTPTIAQVGAQTFTVTATDSSGSTTQRFTVTVDFAVWRIDCGSTESFTDSNGFRWNADTDTSLFNTGFTSSVNTTVPIAGTTNSQLYRTHRWDSPLGDEMSYHLPVTAGPYTVRLHFADIFIGTNKPGARVFNVGLENTFLRQNLDLTAAVGWRTAFQLERDVLITAADGFIDIDLFHGMRENPLISGIEVLALAAATTGPVVFTSSPPTQLAVVGVAWVYDVVATGATPITVSLAGNPSNMVLTGNRISFTPTRAQAGSGFNVTITASNDDTTATQPITVTVDTALIRINCGGSDITLSDGTRWQAEHFSNTGNNHVQDPSMTISPALDGGVIYRTNRWDPATSPEMSYTIPVPNGKYTVELHFAEVYVGARSAGFRVFSFSVEGVVRHNNMDVFALAGFASPFIQSVTVDITDGNIVIGFGHIIENPFVSAIVITIADGTSTPTPPPGPTPTCNRANGFQTVNGKCVFPTTAGLCPNNKVDCSIGCANGAASATLCQGGSCENGVCVPHNFTRADLTTVINVITQFFTDATGTGSIARGIPKEQQPGDTGGALIRAMFHDAAPGKIAQGNLCIFPCSNCETTQGHNNGLQDIMTLLTKVYNDNNLAPIINKADYLYLAGAIALNILSGGVVNVPFRWGRIPHPCVPVEPASACHVSLPNFPGSMPEPQMTFPQLTAIMETRLGFTRREWFCLLGAHSIGRAEPKNTGYARSWVATNSRFSNQYYIDMQGLDWNRENNTNGQALTSVTDPNEPVSGQQEFQDASQRVHTGTMMLNSDVNMFWEIDGSQCPINRGPTGCPRRLDNNEFGVLLEMAGNQNTFFQCFTAAFQKLSELGQGANLHDVV